MNSHKPYMLCLALGMASNLASAQVDIQPPLTPATTASNAITLDAHTDVSPVMRASRLVVFRYDPNRSFALRALKNVFVNVEMPDGELVQGFYLSDPVAWEYHVTGDKHRVLIKPSDSASITTATLITNARSYELTLAAVDPGQPWYQRVQWRVPAADGEANGIWQGQAVDAAIRDDTFAIDPDKLHFNYRITGKGKFSPTTVFDDGTRTWIRFEHIQDMPAVFAKHGRSAVELLDYAMDGACSACIVIPSVHEVIELRLGKETVRLERRG